MVVGCLQWEHTRFGNSEPHFPHMLLGLRQPRVRQAFHCRLQLPEFVQSVGHNRLYKKDMSKILLLAKAIKTYMSNQLNLQTDRYSEALPLQRQATQKARKWFSTCCCPKLCF